MAATKKLIDPSILELPTDLPVASKPKLAPVVDLDALLVDQEQDLVESGSIRLFGQEWSIVQPTNVVHTFRIGDMEHDPMSIVDLVENCVHPDQRSDFLHALKTAGSLSTENLLTIVNAITEVAFARPTSPSSTSSPGTRPRQRARK